MRARLLIVTQTVALQVVALQVVALLPTGCAGGGTGRAPAATPPCAAPPPRAASRPVARRGACPVSTGPVRRVSLEPRCWNIVGSSVLVARPRPHLSLRSGCVARSAASVRLPIRRAGRWRLTWTHLGGTLTGACSDAAVAVVFVSGPGGKLVLAMTPLGKHQADLDVRPRPGDKVVLQFWMRGSHKCGGHVRIRDIVLTRAPPTPGPGLRRDPAPQPRPHRRRARH